MPPHDAGADPLHPREKMPVLRRAPATASCRSSAATTASRNRALRATPLTTSSDTSCRPPRAQQQQVHPLPPLRGGLRAAVRVGVIGANEPRLSTRTSPARLTSMLADVPCISCGQCIDGLPDRRADREGRHRQGLGGAGRSRQDTLSSAPRPPCAPASGESFGYAHRHQCRRARWSPPCAVSALTRCLTPTLPPT